MPHFRAGEVERSIRFTLLGAVLILIGSMATISAQTNSTPPAPTGLSATLTASGISLSWTAPPADPNGRSMSGYAIQRRSVSVTGLSEYATIASGLTTTSHISSDKLRRATEYEYQVRAVYDDGAGGEVNSSYSTSASVTTPVVSRPTNLSVTRTTGGIVLSWNAPSLSWGSVELTFTGYVVYRAVVVTRGVGPTGHGGVQEYELVTELGTSATSFVDLATLSSKQYIYYMQAVYSYVLSSQQHGSGTIIQGITVDETSSN